MMSFAPESHYPGSPEANDVTIYFILNKTSFGRKWLIFTKGAKFV